MRRGFGTTIHGRTWTIASLMRLLSCIRFDEVVVLQGAPLIGIVFSIGAFTTTNFLALALFAAGSCCLVAHIFVLNDWSGINADLKDPNRARGFTSRGVGHAEVACLWIGLLVLSLLLLAPLGPEPLALAAAVAGLSALYSIPAFHAKGIPFLSSLLHLVGGTLHFLLGYSVFRAVDARGLGIGCFFGLVFAAGHLTHETRDREADLLNGIRTNAVAFGKASFFAGLAFFTLADMLLVVMAARGLVPLPLIAIAAIYPLHLHWSLQALRSGLSFASVRRLQTRYRMLYALIGLAMVAMVLIAH